MRRERMLLAVSWVMFAACPAPLSSTDGGVQGGQDSGPTTLEDGGAAFARSSKAQLRFKGPERLTFDIAVALDLAPEKVCTELGQYLCTVGVHPLALGGVDPYGAGLYEAQPFTGATTPIVVDRVALFACNQRVELDVANPGSASIFRNLTLSNGKLAAPNGPEVRTAITSLYQRALLRNPSDDEISALIALAGKLEATATTTPALDWMKLACFVTVSSSEAVFY